MRKEIMIVFGWPKTPVFLGFFLDISLQNAFICQIEIKISAW